MQTTHPHVNCLIPDFSLEQLRDMYIQKREEEFRKVEDRFLRIKAVVGEAKWRIHADAEYAAQLREHDEALQALEAFQSKYPKLEKS